MLTEPYTSVPARRGSENDADDRDGEKEEEKERDIMDSANQHYAWIVSPSPATAPLDPARFLFQWLAVSVTDIPLLVYQSSSESLDELFQVCGRIEQKGWGTAEVASALQRFFQGPGSERASEVGTDNNDDEIESDVMRFFHSELD